MEDSNTTHTSFKSRLDAGIADAETKIREEPLKAVLIGTAAGLILSRLPLFGILILFVRLVLWSIKPALLVFGITKVVEYAKKQQA
jgi:hypothetical protein